MKPDCIDHGKSGYGLGYTRVYAEGKTRWMHRWVYAKANGLDESTMGGVIRHTCDNPRCINEKHLVLGTHLENAQDRVKRGRSNHQNGEAHGIAKLTRADVALIRQLYEPRKVSQASLAKRFGVSQMTISKVIRGETWTEGV